MPTSLRPPSTTGIPCGQAISEIGPVIHIVTPRTKDEIHPPEVSVQPWGADVTGRSTAV